MCDAQFVTSFIFRVQAETEEWQNSYLSEDEFSEYMVQFSLYYLYIGIGVLIAAFVQVSLSNDRMEYTEIDWHSCLRSFAHKVFL